MTRITTFDIPGVPGYDKDVSFPWLWPGGHALSGASEPWASAPVASIYFRITSGSVELYMKTVDSNADSDWKEIYRAGGAVTGDMTITGDLTVTGTVNAGDVVVAE